MAELVNEVVNENMKQAISDRKERSAQTPKITMTEDESEAEIILSGNQDFKFKITYEIIPDFKLADFKKYKIDRQVVKVSKPEIKSRIEELAENNASYAEKKGKSASKDRVIFDYSGKIDDVAFDGGTDTNTPLVLGSNSFIPGFEDQLIGKSAGDEDSIKITFPADYPAEHLAGKKAVFDVLIHKVEKPVETKLDDEFAKSLGVDSYAKLEELIGKQIESQYDQQSRQKVKRKLLDELDKSHKFDLPEDMVKQEFDNIWQEILVDLERQKKTFKDEGTTEDKARKEYGELSERRVRLGLIMGSVGESAKISVSEEEMQKALYEQAQQYPGQEKEIFEFFRNNPDRMASLRAPIYEDKVVSHILESVTLTDKKVSKEDLLKSDDS